MEAGISSSSWTLASPCICHADALYALSERLSSFCLGVSWFHDRTSKYQHIKLLWRLNVTDMPYRPSLGGPGSTVPTISKKRKSSTAFPEGFAQTGRLELAPRPDANAVARHGLHEYIGKRIM